MANGFVYILHFDSALSHAQHYAGCTINPKQRFRAHRTGRGACLTRAFSRARIDFRVGSLFVTNPTNMRRVERSLKRQANLSRYCSICNPDRTIPLHGCTAYPYSEPQTNIAYEMPRVDISTIARLPIETTLKALQNCMSREKDALGFMPISNNEESGLHSLLAAQQVLLAYIGDAIVGYLAFTHNRSLNRIRVQQCYVEDQWRHYGIGTRMVSDLREYALNHQVTTIECSVRSDLAANQFWTAIGFTAVGSKTHKTSKSTLINYLLTITDLSNGEQS